MSKEKEMNLQAGIMSSMFDELPETLQKEINNKATELKEKHKVPFIHVFVSSKKKDGDKPYILYFKPPTKLSEMSVFYYDAQSDPIIGNLKLAKKLIVGGDEEVVSDEFLYMHTGLMTFIPQLLPQADAELKTF